MALLLGMAYGAGLLAISCAMALSLHRGSSLTQAIVFTGALFMGMLGPFSVRKIYRRIKTCKK